jgi:hypothetical protein
MSEADSFIRILLKLFMHLWFCCNVVVLSISLPFVLTPQAELQQQLHSLYERPCAPKLSDRSCALILLRLMSSGVLDLVHTMDGSEYVTRHHLDKEIKREVLRAGGMRGWDVMSCGIILDTIRPFLCYFVFAFFIF